MTHNYKLSKFKDNPYYNVYKIVPSIMGYNGIIKLKLCSTFNNWVTSYITEDVNYDLMTECLLHKKYGWKETVS
jgi:hypothetical protein